MNHWEIWHSKDSNNLVIDERPLWACIVSKTWDWFGGATGHKICCHTPTIFWRIPLGWPRYDHKDIDDDGLPWLDNSLASKLWDLNSYLLSLEDKCAKNIVRIPVADEWMKEHGFWIDWLDEDEATDA